MGFIIGFIGSEEVEAGTWGFDGIGRESTVLFGHDFHIRDLYLDGVAIQ